jgi:formylglycine-generating enzyme required for sulfatase activity
MDIHHDSYDGAPTDGSAWLSGGDPNIRDYRGGSWDTLANSLCSAERDRAMSDAGSIPSGIRVVAVQR